MCRGIYAVRENPDENWRTIGLYRESFPEHRRIGEAVMSCSWGRFQLDDLHVFDAADQRKGFGRCLLRQALNDLAEWDAQVVEAVVEPSLKNGWLMAWYIRLGFQRLADDANGYAHIEGNLPRIRDAMGVKCCLSFHSSVGRPRPIP